MRRECLDHVIVWNEAHLRTLLSDYADYYNASRTHLALEKDAPGFRPVHRVSKIASCPSLATCIVDTKDPPPRKNPIFGRDGCQG
ncbi:MAG: hypothetical protein ABL973_00015 [Micropepsaceae bacterium]